MQCEHQRSDCISTFTESQTTYGRGGFIVMNVENNPVIELKTV